jgi:hypothetical protein
LLYLLITLIVFFITHYLIVSTPRLTAIALRVS